MHASLLAQRCRCSEFASFPGDSVQRAFKPCATAECGHWPLRTGLCAESVQARGTPLLGCDRLGLHVPQPVAQPDEPATLCMLEFCVQVCVPLLSE